MAYAPLPRYEVGNAMNFQPLNEAIDSYNAGQKIAGESMAKIAASNAMAKGDYTTAASELTKVDPAAALAFKMQPLKEQEAANSIEQTGRHLIGGTAEALAAIQDPTQRHATAQKIFSSDPRWATAAGRLGIPVEDTDAMIAAMRAEALGPVNQTDKAAKEATTARSLLYPVDPGQKIYGVTPNPATGGAPRVGTPSVQPLVSGGLTNKTLEERTQIADQNQMPAGPLRDYYLANGKLPDHDLPPREVSIVDANNKAIQGFNVVEQKLLDAKRLSPQAFQGGGAHERANLVNKWIPGFLTSQATQDSASATQQLENITSGQALAQAKADAGSRVTAYLEQQEMKLRAAADQPDSVRQPIIDETLKFVRDNRAKLQEQTDAILNRSYFKPTGTQGYNGSVGPGAQRSGPVAGPAATGKTDLGPLPPPGAARFANPGPAGLPDRAPGAPISPASVRYLINNANDPDVVRQFEERYGPGSAAQFLTPR